jgi:uncharacterized integral membrane protein
MADSPDEQPDGSGWVERKEGGQRDVATARLAVAGVALAAAIVFVVQNSTHVETNFLFLDFNARLWVVILVSVLLGAGLGQAVGLLRRRRKKVDAS